MDDQTVRENRARLSVAGYVLNADFGLWTHSTLDRAIVAIMADQMTPEQVAAWVAAGARTP
jgi:hypothetical protein